MGRRLGGDEIYSCESCALRPALKVILGHDGPPTGAMWRDNLVDKKPLERCPVRTLQLADPAIVAEVHRHVNEYYPFYEDGHLLVAGGIADQPARTVQYMLEIRRLKSTVDARFLEIEKQNGEEA